MNQTFCQNLKEFRKAKNLSQEQLALKLGLTMQAVSKWECGLSYPDVEVLIALSDILEVSVDRLLKGGERKEYIKDIDFSKPDVLYVVQCIGGRVVNISEMAAKEEIPLAIPKDCEKNMINVEIWGGAKINGNVGGYVDAGAGVNCGNVGGYVDAGAGVNCGNVGGYVDAGAGVNCGRIEGYVDAGAGVNCGSIQGDVSCSELHCETIGGNVECDKIYYK